MAKKKTLRRLVALIYVGDRLLFYRVKGAKEFDLPSMDASGLCEKGSFRRHLKKLLGVGMTLERELPEIVYDEGERLIEARAFVFFAREVPTSETLEFELSENGLRDLPKRSNAIILGARGQVYAPFYLGRVRTVPLIPDYAEAAQWMLDCICYFRQIPRKERKEFRGLLNAPSSMTRIKAAFKDLCQAYHADPKDFKEHLEFIKRRRQELK